MCVTGTLPFGPFSVIFPGRYSEEHPLPLHGCAVRSFGDGQAQLGQDLLHVFPDQSAGRALCLFQAYAPLGAASAGMSRKHAKDLWAGASRCTDYSYHMGAKEGQRLQDLARDCPRLQTVHLYGNLYASQPL